MRALALAVLAVLAVLAAFANAMYWVFGNKTCVNVLFATGKKFCYTPTPFVNTTVTINVSDLYYNKNFTAAGVAPALIYYYGNITIGRKSFLVPVYGGPLSFGQPVLFAPEVIAYDAYNMSGRRIKIPAGLLIETSATVVDASGTQPVRGTVKCKDGRVLSENAVYAQTELYITSGGDTYVLDPNACAKLLIATSNYQEYNNTISAVLVFEEPEAKHWGWVVYYDSMYTLATGGGVGNTYLGAYFYDTPPVAPLGYAIFIVGLPDSTTAVLYKGSTHRTPRYYIFPHKKRTISYDEFWGRMYGNENVTYLRLKRNTLYTMYVYNVDEGKAYNVIILPGAVGEYHESFIGYPFCPVVKISNGTHTIGAVLIRDPFMPGYYAAIDFSYWPTQRSYVKIRNNSAKTLIAASSYNDVAHDAVVIPPGGEAFLHIPDTTAWIVLGDHCRSLAWQRVYGGRLYVYDGQALLDAGPADLAEYMEFINAYMKAMMKWWQEALSAVLNATRPSSSAFSMPHQQQIATAVVSGSKTLVQSAVQYSFVSIASRTTQVTGGSFGGLPTLPASIGAYAAGLLVAFAAALALSKNREDPGDRLAAAAAILLPTAVLLSVFMSVDLFQAAATAAALLALAYAVNAGKL